MCTPLNGDQQARLVSDTQIVNIEAVETGANSPASLKDITTP